MVRRHPAFVPLLVLASFLSLPGYGQDVIVRPIAWQNGAQAGDELPKMRGSIRPEFPAALAKTADIGWANLDYSLDKTGGIVTYELHATQPAYARAVELALAGRGAFKPARRAGEPVASRIRLTFIFNPSSASPKSHDAIPRLLDAAEIVDPSLPPVAADGTRTAIVVWATVSVDVQGAVASVRAEPPELARLLRTAAGAFKFAPARAAGAATASEVRVPFILLGRKPTAGKNQVPPRVISRIPPVYPESLQRSGLRGEVVINFVIDEQGRVQNPVVVRTLNPAFNQPAIDSLAAWRFAPATVDGHPVKTRTQQSISFQLNGALEGGHDGVEVLHKARQSGLPEQFRYDTPPKLRTQVLPVYPYACLRDKVRGSARVAVVIGPEGKVISSKVEKADRAEFGLALQAAADLYEYLPAIKNGRPTTTVLTVEEEFGSAGSAVVSNASRDVLALERKHPDRFLKAQSLDGPLKPMLAAPPVFPRDVNLTSDHGEAVVEMVIDEQGEVCTPRLVSASEPVFGYAALQAVSTWRFAPPLSQGKPGVTRVAVPFKFNRH